MTEFPYSEVTSQLHQLTKAELRILNLVGEGLSNEAIAERLNNSLFTVKTHRDHIRTKLGLIRTQSLESFALRHWELIQKLVLERQLEVLKGSNQPTEHSKNTD